MESSSIYSYTMHEEEEMDDVVLKDQRSVLQGKLRFYNTTLYAHSVDVRVGKKINDPQMVEAAKDNIRKAQMCIDELEEMIRELEEAQDD